MIVAAYINHLWIQVNPSEYSYIHCNLLNSNKNNKYYIEAYEYFKEHYNIEILSANCHSTDNDVKLKLILKEREINISTIAKISKDAIFGTESTYDSDNHAEYSYSYILLDIDPDIEKL